MKLKSAILIISVFVCSFAVGMDAALSGKWVAAIQNQEISQLVVWNIAPAGTYSMSLIQEQEGFIRTNPESWDISSPERSTPWNHGKYKIIGPNLFSVVIAGTPYDWVEFKRIPKGSKPTAIPPELLPVELMTEETGKTSDTFNSALIGLWEAIAVSNDRSLAMIWRFQPSGKAICIGMLEVDKGKLEAANGRIKMMPSDGQESQDTYRILNKDSFELNQSGQIIKWTRFK